MISIKSVVVGDLAVNCYIVTDEPGGRTAVIDPGDYSPALDSALREVGFDNIDYILLTHGHFDHTGGVPELLQKTQGKAKLAIHTDETALMNDPRNNLSLAFLGVPIGGEMKPDILLNDGSEIALGESIFRVIHTPGHTRGSVCYLCGENIFSGDTLFYRSAGRTDFPGGSFKQLLQSLNKLAALEGDYSVYPGHNLTTKLSDERNENPYLGNGYGFI